MFEIYQIPSLYFLFVVLKNKIFYFFMDDIFVHITNSLLRVDPAVERIKEFTRINISQLLYGFAFMIMG